MENIIDFTDEKYTLTREQAAVALNISIPTLHKIMCTDDTFPAFHVGKRVYISKKKLADWVSKQAEERNSIAI